jgi:hypothetical protein
MNIKLRIAYEDHHFLPTIHETGFPLSQLRWRAAENTYCECKACESASIHVQSDSSQDYTKADTHNEKHHRILCASPYENGRGDILHYPVAIRLACQPDNFFCESVSEMKKTIMYQRPYLHVDKQTCRHEVEQHQNSQRFCGSDGEAVWAPSLQVARVYA